LLGKLKSRGVTIDQMLPAALAIIAGSTAMCADYDWGPVLQIAFPSSKFKPGVRPPLPDKLTEAQRAVLEALVANELLWDPRNGNASLARMKVGLTDNRDGIQNAVKNENDYENIDGIADFQMAMVQFIIDSRRFEIEWFKRFKEGNP